MDIGLYGGLVEVAAVVHEFQQHKSKLVAVGFPNDQLLVAIEQPNFLILFEPLVLFLDLAFNKQPHWVVITHQVVLCQSIDVLNCDGGFLRICPCCYLVLF